MKCLLLGSGGREHALAWKLSQSPKLEKLFCAPGSQAISALAERASLDMLDPQAVSAFCAKNRIALVVVGPEAPLAAGVADVLSEKGIMVFGPGRLAARLESSKSFAKQFMGRHEIPTASFEVCAEPGQALKALKAMELPVVVKADGLAAGKGVRVCRSSQEALSAVRDFMEKETLGPAGKTVVIEEFLEGPELTVMALTDGKSHALLPPSRDHKRLKDEDQGPNTGGMGAYAPVPLDEKTLAKIKAILDQVLSGLAAEGLDYRGVLYAGLMLTAQGPRVLEFNCRFGDPEAQAVLPLLETDLLDLAQACAERRLQELKLSVRTGACLCLVLASEGYPEKPRTGRPINGLESLAPSPDLMVFHAGTLRQDGQWLTAGGRVLGVTALGRDLSQARERAYEAASRIGFEGVHFRRDIAGRVLQEA